MNEGDGVLRYYPIINAFAGEDQVKCAEALPNRKWLAT
jgi:hypothetical protein